MILHGSKGDAARLLGLPAMLIDDSPDNVTEFLGTAPAGSAALQARHVSKRAFRRGRRLTLGDVQQWMLAIDAWASEL